MSAIIGEPVTTSEPGAWLSIQDAARHLSVSERTIYRKADQGKLRRRSRPDGRVEVFVPMTPLSAKSDDSSDFGSQPSALLLVEHLTHALTRQAEAFNAELGASRQRIEDLARENGRQAAELERAAAIAAKLSDELDAARTQISTLAASTATVSPDPTTEPPWTRWRDVTPPWLLTLLTIVAAIVLLGWLR